MLFRSPELGEGTLEALDEVYRLHEQLASAAPPVPRRWFDRLWRLSLARAIQGSNSIEGYHASLDDVAATIRGDEPLDVDHETRLALTGYWDGMQYVLHAGQEKAIRIDDRLIRSLHFVIMRYQQSKNPGRWRPGPTWVRRELDGKVLYEAPSERLVPKLVEELIPSLEPERGRPVIVQAAMAHLNLAMIHPFSDGNGRLARCLQTLVLARQKVVAPEFASIEEYLGANRDAYFSRLSDVGGGSWNPERDAAPWVNFCITGHYRQARRLLRRIEESEQLWAACTSLGTRAGIPQRALLSMADAARGFRVRNATYRSVVADAEGAEVTEQTANRDLKLLADRGLFVSDQRGIYRAGPALAAAWQRIKDRRPPSDSP